MNIKKAKEKLEEIKKYFTLTNQRYLDCKNMREIIEALDEPTDTCFHNDGDMATGCVNLSHRACNHGGTSEISNRYYNENRQLKFDLAIANGLIKNLEESLIAHGRQITKDRNPFHIELSNKIDFGKCHFCHGSGMRNKNDEIAVYGRSLKSILDIINYAYKHGYKETT